MEEIDVEPLTEAVFLKTHGNVFYSQELLRSLVNKRIVRYSSRWLQWEWDVTQVAKQANVTDNVVYLIIQKMKSLPDQALFCLQIASCFGTMFDVQNVFGVQDTILRQREAPETSRKSREDALALLELQGLILPPQNDGLTHRFSHDTVQHAAYTLLGENDGHKPVHLKLAKSCLNEGTRIRLFRPRNT